jgi:ubiquinone/menaquinone biosynthesis C-methylase UbiE
MPTTAIPPDQLLSLLRDPVDLNPLELEGDALVNRAGARCYTIADSIPVLVDQANLGPQNARIQKMYGWMAKGFDMVDRVGNLFSRGAIIKLRRLMAQKLAIKPGDCLLYTSIGTGLDLPYLAEQTPLKQFQLVGLDLTMEMLRQCQKKLAELCANALLVQANAERLPFADGTFDVLLHVGGINLFDHPAQAAAEMARVAKPGALILIADETPKVVKESYQKGIFTRRAVKDISTKFDPRTWVPADVCDVNYEEVWRGKGYFLTFRRNRFVREQET